MEIPAVLSRRVRHMCLLLLCGRLVHLSQINPFLNSCSHIAEVGCSRERVLDVGQHFDHVELSWEVVGALHDAVRQEFESEHFSLKLSLNMVRR